MSDETKGRGVMKLSLNYPALERLLGGDSELEVELRHQVVRQFTHNHLSPLMTSPAVKAVLDKIQDASIRALDENVGKYVKNWSGSKFELAPEFKKNLELKVKELVETQLQQLGEVFQQALKEREVYWMGYADRAVTRRLDSEIEKKIKEGIEKRLAAAVMASK